jgi:hypothetical protein
VIRCSVEGCPAVSRDDNAPGWLRVTMSMVAVATGKERASVGEHLCPVHAAEATRLLKDGGRDEHDREGDVDGRATQAGRGGRGE